MFLHDQTKIWLAPCHANMLNTYCSIPQYKTSCHVMPLATPFASHPTATMWYHYTHCAHKICHFSVTVTGRVNMHFFSSFKWRAAYVIPWMLRMLTTLSILSCTSFLSLNWQQFCHRSSFTSFAPSMLVIQQSHVTITTYRIKRRQ